MDILDEGSLSCQAGGEKKPGRRFVDVVKDEMQRIGVTKDDVRIGLDGGT